MHYGATNFLGRSLVCVGQPMIGLQVVVLVSRWVSKGSWVFDPQEFVSFSLHLCSNPLSLDFSRSSIADWLDARR